EGVLTGTAPAEKYVHGAGIGAALGLYPGRGPGVRVGLATHLPLQITFGHALGRGAAVGLARARGTLSYSDTLVPIAAGLIVGEALTSLGTTLVQLAGGGS